MRVPRRTAWTAEEEAIAIRAARNILYGASFYSETKRLKAGPLKDRSEESIRNKLIRMRNYLRKPL